MAAYYMDYKEFAERQKVEERDRELAMSLSRGDALLRSEQDAASERMARELEEKDKKDRDDYRRRTEERAARVAVGDSEMEAWCIQGREDGAAHGCHQLSVIISHYRHVIQINKTST